MKKWKALVATAVVCVGGFVALSSQEKPIEAQATAAKKTVTVHYRVDFNRHYESFEERGYFDFDNSAIFLKSSSSEDLFEHSYSTSEYNHLAGERAAFGKNDFKTFKTKVNQEDLNYGFGLRSTRGSVNGRVLYAVVHTGSEFDSETHGYAHANHYNLPNGNNGNVTKVGGISPEIIERDLYWNVNLDFNSSDEYWVTLYLVPHGL